MKRRGSIPLVTLHRSLRSERGIALPMVLLIFIVGVALVSAFLVAIVGSSQVTAANKSIVQAQAAAEAGIAAAEVSLTSGGLDPCASNLSTLASGSTDWTYTVTAQCVTKAGDTQLVVRSNGSAGGVTSKVEAVFEVIPGGSPPPSGPTGSQLVYAGGFSLSEFDSDLRLSAANPTSVTSAFAPYACTGHSTPGDVFGGNDAYLNGCTINGNLMLTGRLLATAPTQNPPPADLPVSGSNKVTGNITAAGTGSHIFFGTVGGSVKVNGDFTLHGGSVVNGDLHVTGTGKVTIRGTVKGNVYATGAVTVDWGGKIEGSLYSSSATAKSVLRSDVLGNIVVAGSISVEDWNRAYPGKISAGDKVTLVGGNQVGQALPGCVVGSVNNNIEWSSPPSGVDIATRTCKLEPPAVQPPIRVDAVAAVAPTIQGWQDYSFKKEQWPGYDVEVVKSNQCSQWQGHPGPAWNQLKNLKENTLFDLRACPNITTNGSQSHFKDEEVGVNVAFLLNSADLNGFQLKAKSGTNPTVWFIQEGTSENGAPRCPVSTTTALNLEGTKLDSSLTTMLYTPCGVHLSNSTLKGSIYAGRVTTGGSSNMAFTPIGLPGWNTGTGGSGTGTGSVKPRLGNLLVQRNVD